MLTDGAKALAVALIAAVVPATAAINGCQQRAVEEERNQGEIRIKYLERALDPNYDLLQQRRVLTFLVMTLKSGDPTREWATHERDRVEEVIGLRSSKDELRDERARKEQLLLSARSGREEGERPSPRETILQEEIAELDARIAELQKQIAREEEEIGASSVETSYRMPFGASARGYYLLELWIYSATRGDRIKAYVAEGGTVPLDRADPYRRYALRPEILESPSGTPPLVSIELLEISGSSLFETENVVDRRRVVTGGEVSMPLPEYNRVLRVEVASVSFVSAPPTDASSEPFR